MKNRALADLVAADVMTEDPMTVRSDATIAEAAELLQSVDFRHLPVLSEEGELVGMLSDRDLRALELPYAQDPETLGTLLTRARAPVSALMSSNVVTAEPDTTLGETIELMLDHKIGAIPIVDGEGRLVGIVSYQDVLRHLLEAA